MFETVCKYICSVADLYFCPQYISGGPRRRHTTGAAELVTPKLLQSVSTQTWCGAHRGDVNMGTAVNISPVKEIGMITLGQHVVTTYLPVLRVYVNH